MCNFDFKTEVTKEQIENAMLIKGEYIEKDGKYFIGHPSMLDGYVCPCAQKKEERFDSIKRSYWQRLFGTKPICPDCGKKMKRIEWPYEPGWQCPTCKWITWEKLS